MRVVAVRQGDVFPARYLTMLRRMVETHAGVPFTALTDAADTDSGESGPAPEYDTRPLRAGLPGWWSKIELFAPWNADLRPFLFVDLDTFILDDIRDLVTWQPDRLAMLSDFYHPHQPASGVMAVPVEDTGIWEQFSPDAIDRFRGGGDQAFIASVYANPIRLQDRFAGIQSYKVHGLGGRICCFHGVPKPHDCPDPRVKEIYDQP